MEEKAARCFEGIRTQLCADDADITPGKMMSHEGIKYKGKVFASFGDGIMTFKLGKSFDPEAHHLSDWNYLSPFKNKPPMKAWFQVAATQMDRWGQLAELALEEIKRS